MRNNIISLLLHIFFNFGFFYQLESGMEQENRIRHLVENVFKMFQKNFNTCTLKVLRCLREELCDKKLMSEATTETHVILIRYVDRKKVKKNSRFQKYFSASVC